MNLNDLTLLEVLKIVAGINFACAEKSGGCTYGPVSLPDVDGRWVITDESPETIELYLGPDDDFYTLTLS